MTPQIINNKIQHFLMIDNYHSSNDEDKEFLGAIILAAKVVYALANPISLLTVGFKTLRKNKLAW